MRLAYMLHPVYKYQVDIEGQHHELSMQPRTSHMKYMQHIQCPHPRSSVSDSHACQCPSTHAPSSSTAPNLKQTMPFLNGRVHAPLPARTPVCTRLCIAADSRASRRGLTQLPTLQRRQTARRAVCSSQESRGWTGEGRDAEMAGRLPTQGESVVRGIGGDDLPGVQVKDRPMPPGDIDYLSVR